MVGLRPASTTERLNEGQSCVTSSSAKAGFRIASTRPGLWRPPSPRCSLTDPRRRSRSTRRTRASGAWASAPARLMAVVVFPSPLAGLDTARTDSRALLWNCSTRCRSPRYCSAAKEVGVRRLTRCSSAPSTAPVAGVGPGSRTGAAGDGSTTAGRELDSICPRRARSRSACSRALKNVLIDRILRTGPAQASRRAPRSPLPRSTQRS